MCGSGFDSEHTLILKTSLIYETVINLRTNFVAAAQRLGSAGCSMWVGSCECVVVRGCKHNLTSCVHLHFFNVFAPVLKI